MATLNRSKFWQGVVSLAVAAMTVLPVAAWAGPKGRGDGNDEDERKAKMARPADPPRAAPRPSNPPAVRSAPRVEAPRTQPSGPRSAPRVESVPRSAPRVESAPRTMPRVEAPRVTQPQPTPSVAKPEFRSLPKPESRGPAPTVAKPPVDSGDRARLTERRTDTPSFDRPKVETPTPRGNPSITNRAPVLSSPPKMSVPDRGPGPMRDLQAAGGRGDADKLRERAVGPKSGVRPPEDPTPDGRRGVITGAPDRRSDSPPTTVGPRTPTTPRTTTTPPPATVTNPPAGTRVIPGVNPPRTGPEGIRTSPPDLKLGGDSRDRGGKADDPRHRLDERFGVKPPQGTQPGSVGGPGRDGKPDRRDGPQLPTGPSGVRGPDKGMADKLPAGLPRGGDPRYTGGRDRPDNRDLHIDPKDIQRANFGERYRSGELDKVVKGDTAHKLKLDDQYKYAQKGDVARRLDLQKNVTNVVNVKNVSNVTNITNVNGHRYDKPYYHGWVSPNYHHSCFEFNYWGHGFFAGVCWYPRWNPWVDWSWNYHCHPIWDPRPIWCRPIVYAPAPVWVYYPVPVWQPLPVVASGTWVDVPKVVVPEQADLQLLAVRFVDPGHPEEKLGPRYRVWLRNNSDSPVTQPFNVVAMASANGRVAQGLPQAGVRVTSIEAGDTQSFDIRLPADVFAMNRTAQGQAAPFSTLHVIADANRELQEATRANNGANIARDEILPVDPASFGVDPNRAAEGSEVVIAGEGLGPRPGQVLVNAGGVELDAEIVGWYDLGARVVLPKLPAGAAREAELVVIRSDGAAANPVKITIAPTGQAEMPLAPADGPVFPEL